MDLNPKHRLPLKLPKAWPACAQQLLRQGASWFHTGLVRPGDEGGDLLALPTAPLLESRWTINTHYPWSTALDGRVLNLSPWNALQQVLEDFPFPWIGAASYELACSEAGMPHQQLQKGMLGMRWQGVKEALWVRKHQAELWSWESVPPSPDFILNQLGHSCSLKKTTLCLSCRWTPSQHQEAVLDIQRQIRDGNFYVANLCIPFKGELQGDLITFALAAVRRAQPPYGAFMNLGNLHLLSLSMERLLARRKDRLWTEPIKGSVPLTGDRQEDERSALLLQSDPKEQAEHTMIVDLLRNDLGRVAQTGSVAVSKLMTLERFPTVQHLVSRIDAQARPGLKLPELLRSILPGGSVTGAPKHAVCSYLSKVEAEPRGFYCGALGWIAPNGDLDLAMPIRTAQIDGKQVIYWTGGGITLHSIPDREWKELALKTQAILQAK